MSTSAETTQPATSGTPLYKRRRRRIYAIIAAAVVVIVGLSVGLSVGLGGSAGPLPNFVISLSTGTVANSDSIIVSDPSLKKTIPAHVSSCRSRRGHRRGRDEERLAAVDQRRRQPARVAAIGTGTGIDIVIAQSFDSDELLVPKSVTQPSQLAGKSVGRAGRLLRRLRAGGLAQLEGLTGMVKLVGVASEQAAAAAYLSGAVDAAYVYGGYAALGHGQGRPPADQRREDRQARRPRHRRGGGVRHPGQEPPGPGPEVRLRRGPGHPGPDRTAVGQVPDPGGQGAGRARPTRSSRPPSPTRSSRSTSSCTGSAPRRATPAARSSRPTRRPASSWSSRAG